MKRIKIKTILCHFAIISICMGVFCHGYISGNSLSLADRINVYAEDDVVSRSDVVESFKAYCRDRNLLINGSIAGSAFEWTGSAIDSALKVIGVDMDYLQAQISKETSGNLGVRWLVNATGMNIYNRLFAELLQRESLQVGDENVDKTVYSGDRFTDDDGNSCLVYHLSTQSETPTSYQPADPVSIISSYGSKLKYNSDDLFNMLNMNEYVNLTFNINGVQYRGNKSSVTYLSNGLGFGKFNGWYDDYHKTDYLSAADRYYCMKSVQFPVVYGEVCVFKLNGNYYIGSNRFNWGYGSVKQGYCRFVGVKINNPGDTTEPTDVDITTPPDKKILPDPPEDPTTIYPGDNPGGGGDPGGGGGGEPDNWNPSTPTIPDPSSPDFPSVNLPDIDIPDLPSLNFSLGDLRNKFPFSLPFDIIAVLNVLDGEPQAPHIQATVPIGKWYTWEMDFDFSEFDNYARIFRAFEFIGFCIGLAIFTVHFVKG